MTLQQLLNRIAQLQKENAERMTHIEKNAMSQVYLEAKNEYKELDLMPQIEEWISTEDLIKDYQILKEETNHEYGISEIIRNLNKARKIVGKLKGLSQEKRSNPRMDRYSGEGQFYIMQPQFNVEEVQKMVQKAEADIMALDDQLQRLNHEIQVEAIE